jgi:very-short-patch-repair endonuclease
MSREKTRFYTPKTGKLWGALKSAVRQLRQESTRAEDALWEHLRRRQMANLKFRRQHAIDRFVVDFFSAEANLVIEVDGPTHADTRAQDTLRQDILESMGLRILRFSNDDVLHHMEDVLASIRKELNS